MNYLKKKRAKAPYCHRCNASKGGVHRMILKDGFGWVCPDCGYLKDGKGAMA